MYLAWKTGKFFPIRATEQFETIQWLMFQMGGVGPFFGQVHHFLRAAPEPVPYAIERYTKETRRLYGVMNRHLEQHEYLASGLLDRRHRHLPMGGAPRVAQGGPERLSRRSSAGSIEIGARPAVQAGMKIPQIVR